MGYNSADHENKAYVSMGAGFTQVSDSNTFTLGSIKPDDGCWSSSSDYLQVLNNTSAGVIGKYVYYGAWEDAEEDEIGWWDSDFDGMHNDLPVNPGDAWLGAFGAQDVKLAFPGALD